MDLVKAGLTGPHSFLAIAEASDTLVGCRLNQLVEAGKPEEPSPDYGFASTNAVAGFVDELSKGLSDLLPPATHKLLKFVVVGVHPDVGGPALGLAS